MGTPRRRKNSLRLEGYDYTQPGAYFVTICTWQRECLFGDVVEGLVNLSPLGLIVYEEWMRSNTMRQEIQLHADEFIIMPNHIHGIVWIHPPVGADGVRPDGLRPNGTRPDDLPAEPGGGARRAPLRRVAKSLGAFAAGFKSSVTRRARDELQMTGIWQRNYYEHIIRNETEWAKIADYIQTNPARWAEDRFHPDAPPDRFNGKMQNGKCKILKVKLGGSQLPAPVSRLPASCLSLIAYSLQLPALTVGRVRDILAER